MKFSKRIILFLILSACGYKAPPPGKPDFEAPEIKVLNLKDKDTIRDTTEILLEVKDKSQIIWVKMFVNGEEYSVDTVSPYRFLIPPPDKIWKIAFSAMDVWENKRNTRTFEIYGPFIDTMKIDTLRKERKEN